MKATKWLGKDVPSTVAAAWNKPSNGGPLTIAFACACVGKEDIWKEMNTARRDYVRGLHALVQNCMIGISKDTCPNESGNCPEFVAWGAICKAGETYRSLCLNVNRDKSYKCCNHCSSLAKATWKGNSLCIEDWFDKSSLITGPPEQLWNGYVGCNLKPIRDIIAEGRGRGVHKPRQFVLKVC